MARQEHPGQVPRDRQLRLDRVGLPVSGRRIEQAAHLVEEGRARLGDAVLVAVAVGEEEPSVGQRQAGVEEVALLGVGVAPRLEAEREALRFGEERVLAAVAARELAVLERGDEGVLEARGSQPVGAGDPHPALDRPAPGVEAELAQGRRQPRRRRRKRGDLGQFGERGRDRGGGAQLEAVAPPRRRAVLAAAQGARRHRRGKARQLGRQGAGSLLRRPPDSREVVGQALVPLLPELHGVGRSDQAAAAHGALEPVDLARRQAAGAAHEAQQVGGAATAELRFQQRDQRASDRGPGDRDLRLEGHADPVGLEHGREQRSAPRRVAQGDRDRRGVGAVGDQLRQLGADRLRLAALARRAQQHESVARRLGAPARPGRTRAGDGRAAGRCRTVRARAGPLSVSISVAIARSVSSRPVRAASATLPSS